MSIRNPHARRGTRAATLLCGLLALGLLAAWGLGDHRAGAAEFITPPGLNVEGQQALLRDQVRRIAQDLVGEAVVEVLAHVRYIRTDGVTGRRVKLPGFNHFITPAAKGSSDIVAGHARVRQIVVMVAESVRSTPEALADEIRQQGNFDATKGDLVRVVKVAAPGQPPAPASAARDADLAKDAGELAKRLDEERAKQEEEKASAALGKMMAQGSLAEAQATTFLIRARQAYFNGDYDRALDQILQSIAQNPNNPQAYAMLGSLYFAVDWKQLALKYWQKSLTLDPDNREIQDLVARLRSGPSF